jgi:hypothetical protein
MSVGGGQGEERIGRCKRRRRRVLPHDDPVYAYRFAPLDLPRASHEPALEFDRPRRMSDQGTDPAAHQVPADPSHPTIC